MHAVSFSRFALLSVSSSKGGTGQGKFYMNKTKKLPTTVEKATTAMNQINLLYSTSTWNGNVIVPKVVQQQQCRIIKKF